MQQTAQVPSAGDIALDLLESSSRWRVHSVFDHAVNLVRIPDVAHRNPRLLHLSPARASDIHRRLGSPFGLELSYPLWRQLRQHLARGRRSRPWYWSATQACFYQANRPVLALGRNWFKARIRCALESWQAACQRRQALAELPLPEASLAEHGELTRQALHGLLAGDIHAACRLLGRGQGLTPSGDDTLIGLLALLKASRLPGHSALGWSRLAQLVQTRGRDMTTDVACAYLHAALQGYFAQPLRRLLGCPADQPGQLSQACTDLLALGHSSGADTLMGIVHGARLLNQSRHIHATGA